jgi:UDP-N-acetylmuramoyl-tripeptide--D-alanyl-D-alanine ligase
VAVLNVDDPAVAAMAEVTAARVVRVSRNSQTDVWAGPVTLDELARPQFALHSGDAVVDVTLAVHGDHQVSNALCAAAVALECGATLEQVAAALAWISAGTGGGPVGKRRSWAVLGEMAELGDDAISEHDRIGRLAVRLDVSRLIVVGTGRSMSAMHHGAVMEGSWGGEAAIAADADAALALLRAELQPGDVVLVKASNAAGLGALADSLADSAVDGRGHN